MNNRHKIAVLLAAYNGEKYILEQIESILNQANVSVSIFINVDLSTDSTKSLVSNLAIKYPAEITALSCEKAFGSAGKNFFSLIKNVDIRKFDFVAFADQDDIWHSDKLFRATQVLQEYDCYSSNVIAFWEGGREVLIDKSQSQREWDFLFEAAGPGCTYVLRRDVAIKFKTWLIEHYDKITHDIALHDWLIYAFCRHFGYRWFIDPRPGMRYRQHANNQVGTNNSISAAKKRLLLIKGKWYRNQVTKIAEHLELQNLSMVKYGLNKGYIGNLYLLFNVNQLRRRLRDRIALSFALLFNIF
ncbi:glycosyltransferase [Aeromonas veronii]